VELFLDGIVLIVVPKNPTLIPLVLNLGFLSLSASPPRLLPVSHILAQLTKS
jgi:hypothetical protein